MDVVLGDVSSYLCTSFFCFECLFVEDWVDEVWEQTERPIGNLEFWAEKDVPFFLETVRRAQLCDLREPLDLPLPARPSVDLFNLSWSDIKSFLTQTEGSVPEFGRPLPVALKSALGECEHGSIPQKERLGRLDDCLWASFWVLSVFALLPFVLGIPLPLLAVFSPVVFSGIALFTMEWTWGYSLGCVPYIPASLPRDLELYFRSRLTPGAFSSKFPTLGTAGAFNCSVSGEELSWTGCECSMEDSTYRVCDLPGYDSYFFAPLVFLKLNLPSWYEWFYEVAPFSSVVQDWDLYFTVWQLEEDRTLMDCYHTRFGDLLLLPLGVYLAFPLLVAMGALTWSFVSFLFYSVPPLMVLLLEILESLLG